MAFNKANLTPFPWPGPRSDPAHQRAFYEHFSDQLGNPSEEEWYQVRKADFKAAGGLSMLTAYFNGSAFQFLHAQEKDISWRPWSFGSVPKDYWKKKENRSAYIEFLAERLRITKPEEWYNVTANQIRDNDGGGWLMHYENSPVLAIVDLIDGYPWKPELFVKGKKTQKRLFELVCKIFCPENDKIKLVTHDVEFDHKHETLLFRDSKRSMEIDVFVPAIGLAFEYQGEQHYKPIECWGGEEALKKVQARDQEKQDRCHRANITLVTIPYTWTGEASKFMEYVTKAWNEREEARKKAAAKMPRMLIKPKRPTEPRGGRAPEVPESYPVGGDEVQDKTSPS